MLISDGGGGYAGTDWNSKDIRYMWSAIAAQETDSHFDVVSGWKQTAHLTSTHLGQVQQYRDNLAAVWPPQKSPAAAAYIDRLDDLIASLKATHEAASANYTVFSSVAATLSSARHKLRPILEQYEANERANLAWQAAQDAKPIDPAKPAMMVFPPVAEAQQEQLNSQARVIMYDLSSTLISGQMALQKPQPYDPKPYSRDDSRGTGDRGLSGLGFATPPTIPSPGDADTQLLSSSPRPSSAAGTAHVGPSSETPDGPGHFGTGSGTGPSLGGIGTHPVITPPTIPLHPVGNLATPPPISLPNVIPGVISPGGSARPLAPVPSGRPPQPGTTAGGGIPSGRTAMPPGGVIGAPPGSGLISHVPAVPTSRTPTGAGANPVGGIIGQQGPPPGRIGLRPSGNATTPNAALQPQAHSIRKHSDSKSGRDYWDPDNPWATAKGVDPILLPPRESGPIDPGPAIGLNR